MQLIIRTKNKNFDAPFFEMKQFESEPRFVFNVDANCNFEFTKRLYNSSIENEVLEFCIDTDRDKDYLLEELEKMDSVYISPYDTNITKFFEINSDLQNKKMILLGKYSVLDNETLIEISKKFEKFENNVYVNLEGNVEPVLLMDACRTVSEINRRAEYIKSLNLSPLEQVMYTYDMVRNRIYTKEGKKQGSDVSRDLSKVLFNNRIVCVGYSQIFKAILKKLGIKSDLVGSVALKGTKEEKLGNGHERNAVHIKDEKYGVDGLYYFDTTWDSKKTEFDKDFVNRYRYFGLNQSQMDEVNEISKQDIGYSGKDIDLDNLKEKLYSFFKSKDMEKIISYFDVALINKLSKIYYGYTLVPMGEYTIKGELVVKTKLEEMINKFKSPVIPKSTMEQLILNVKKVEYEHDRELCPYDISNSKIYATTKGSYYVITPEYINYHKEEIEKVKELDSEYKDLSDVEKYINILEKNTKRYEETIGYQEENEEIKKR